MITDTKRKAKDARLKREFHITLEQYDKVFKFQGKCCAICKKKLNKKGLPLVFFVDHCHTTGKVRGIICFLCNKGIAIFQDNAEWLANASGYLIHSPFVAVIGEIFTAPGKVGTKARRKRLEQMKKENNGKAKKTSRK